MLNWGINREGLLSTALFPLFLHMTLDAANQPFIAILDYGMGNLRSVHRAFIAVGGSARIVRNPEEAKSAQALVFPGQGAIMDTMRLLNSKNWDHFIRDWISADRPYFGICLGLQALFDYSEEGETDGLGIFPGKVKRFDFAKNTGTKVPHMGWNSVHFADTSDPLARDIDASRDQFYFVHSYYVDPGPAAPVWATTTYGDRQFCSAIRKGNLVATQFHPEKSQSKGLLLYRNFVDSLKVST